MTVFKTIKTSLKSIARTQDVHDTVKTYAERMSRIIRFAYMFSRFIFLNELAHHTDAFAARYGSLVCREFFQEVIKTLGNVQRRAAREPLQSYRIIIDFHLENFLQLTGYNPAAQANQVVGLAGNVSVYSSIQMETNYLKLFNFSSENDCSNLSTM